MISVEEAKEIIVESTKSLESHFVAVGDSCGHTLAANVFSRVNQPPFRQSAMDGYAVNHNDLDNQNFRLKLNGEVPAGAIEQLQLNKGEAIRIFTGAPVPEGADTVIMQENTTVEGEWVIVSDAPSSGSNIRAVGEEVREGQLALATGTLINAAGIGFLSMLGITEIEVFKKPRIAILVTGDELVEPGIPLGFGQVYESNAIALKNALTANGFETVEIQKLKDDYEQTRNALDEITARMDAVIISGGISVGDYDYVGKSLKELGASQLFYKIRQKPGKPMYYGWNKNAFVFALPGNPASMLTCYYEYVLPALRMMSGQQNCFLERRKAVLTHNYLKKGDRAVFLRGHLNGDEVTVLDGQSSFMMWAFALANCLIYISGTEQNIEAGDHVTVDLIPL